MGFMSGPNILAEQRQPTRRSAQLLGRSRVGFHPKETILYPADNVALICDASFENR